ncbi:interferon-induced transmembrane protein 1-like [Ambystoma mexicanum]|uniref:interferon-induced transmembrane protein 1-like n=1 Tax=Ambystoma mexicanum TaxID=8296 RepID=UPI0037E9B2DB
MFNLAAYSKDAPEPSAPSNPPPMEGPGFPSSTHGTAPPHGPPMQPPNVPVSSQYPPGYPQHTIGFMQGQNMVVTSRPTVIMGPVHVYEPDYLCFSVFNMLCCCLCIGIAALVFSVKTREANQRGDINEARIHSSTARTLNFVSLGIGIAITIAWVAYVIYATIVVRSMYSIAYGPYYYG